MDDEEVLCWDCETNPDPDRANENSGYCPYVCFQCGACAGCDGSC